LYLRCHPSLILKRKEVFDYGVAEDYIKASIGKLAQIRCITNNRFDVGERLWFGLQIESNDLDVISIHPTPVFPKQICTPNVQDAQRTRQRRN